MLDYPFSSMPVRSPGANLPTGAMLVTPSPCFDESLFGYITRLTENNGYDHPNWIFSCAGLPIDIRRKAALIFSPNSVSFAGLARLTAQCPDSLASLCCPPADRTRSRGDCLLFGQPVPRYMLRPGRSKICPDCLQEAAYVRLIWDFAPVTACPRHRRLLIDRCPDCQAQISWTRKTVCKCKCGCDWRRTPPAVPLAEDEIILSSAIYHLLGIAPPMSEEPKLKAPLCDLTLRGLVCAVFFVAGQLEGIMDVHGKRLATSRKNAPLHLLLGRAQSVFDCWPDNFRSFLEWRRHQFGKTAHSSGLVRDFHEYKAALYSKFALREFDFLRLAFEDYLRDHWTGGVIGKRKWTKGGAHTGTKFLSRRHVSKALGIPGIGIDALLKSGCLRGTVRATTSNRLVLIEADSVTKLKSELKDALYLRDAKRLLGLSGKAIHKLVVAGLLHPVRGPSVDGNSDWHFNLKDVIALLFAFERAVTRNQRITTSQKWSFLHASRRMRQVGVDLSGLIRCVLEGSIVPCDRNNRSGLPGFEFEAAVIVAFVSEHIRRKVGEVLTLKEACTSLQTNTATLVFLAKTGKFPAWKRPELPGLGLLITRDAFEQFDATYTLLGPVAAMHRTSPSHLKSLLSRFDIKPISGPDIDNGPADIFYRSELRSLDLSVLLATNRKNATEQVKSRCLLTQQDVARMLHLSPEKICQFVENGVLKPCKGEKNTAMLRFSRYAVEKLRGHSIDFTGLVSTRVAAKLLGKSVSNLHEQYVHRGLLPFVKTKGAKGNLFFQKSAVEGLKNLMPHL